MRKPGYSNHYYNKLCKKKDLASKKTLLELQFDRIGEFNERNRTLETAKAYPEVFKSPFKPCKLIIRQE